ncbi:MAG: stage III sporulation protein AD [Oscillospiraceae bacterium]|jgi:stage III sporulation protein AD|nr:stage III sporulation protein AD [Oscillospiraceae bacterium]
MESLALFLLAIICSMICVMLKEHNPEYSFILSLAAGTFMILSVFSKASSIFVHLKNLLFAANLSSDYGSVLFKCLGICFISQFSSDSCKDAGQTSLASKVELVGKILVVVTSLPIFEKVVETAEKLLRI